MAELEWSGDFEQDLPCHLRDADLPPDPQNIVGRVFRFIVASEGVDGAEQWHILFGQVTGLEIRGNDKETIPPSFTMFISIRPREIGKYNPDLPVTLTWLEHDVVGEGDEGEILSIGTNRQWALFVGEEHFATGRLELL